MYYPKILSLTVHDVCFGDGGGCLSVDREVPGFLVRHNIITVSYFDLAGEIHKVRLLIYEAFVVLLVFVHINGIMFFDHIF
ncbi:peptide deformylase, partial [Enterococcus faecalis]|uniref:peptide deformylase n=1 Tax=Enterococcus faecalis TaxID=1351 RepID=UPI003D6C6168